MLKHANRLAEEIAMILDRGICSLVLLVSVVLGSLHFESVTQADCAKIGVVSPAIEASRSGDEREIAGIKLCWCAAGQFRMGSPPEEPGHRSDEGQVEVTLSKGFWMGKHEVTQGQRRRR